MSLYILAAKDRLPDIHIPTGLHIEESTDIILLSYMGNTHTEDIRKRLANDHTAYIAWMDDEPAAFGWIARGSATIGELNHTLILPIANRYLWNFRTMEKFRGIGIYPALLQYMIKKESALAALFWIIHAPENNPSLRGIKKAGFNYVGKLYTEAGTTSIENSPLTRRYADMITKMDIVISKDQPASCWNCSSPYLKKRNPVCCCNMNGSKCIRGKYHETQTLTYSS